MTKIIKKPVAFMLALALVLTLVLGTLTACGSKNKVLAEGSGVKVKAEQVDELSNMLAVINGVTLGGLEPYMQQNVKNQMTNFVVENEVIKTVIKEKDVITDDVKTQVDAQIEQLYGYSEDMKQNLKSAGVSEDTIRYYIESQYYSQAYYTKVSEENPVSDEEINAYYEEHKGEDSFQNPESIEISQILVSDAAISADGRKKAEDIRAQILDGEDFAALAEKLSDDETSAVSGGAIGTVTPGSGRFGDEFNTVALSLKKKGDVSKVIESTYGFHILKATSNLTEASVKTLEESSEQITALLQQEHYKAALKKLKEDSKIKYNIDVDPETGEPATNLQPPAADEESAAQ
jgi:parvulin-like peptidyl-prolyl isomerase